MDKMRYEALRKKDFRNLDHYLMNMIRDDDRMREDTLAYRVSVSMLALIMQDAEDKFSLMRIISNKIKDETTLNFLEKVQKESIKQIEEIAQKFDADTLKSAVLFSDPHRFSEADIYSTPAGISNLALSILNPRKEDSILDLGSGVNSFLIRAAQESESQDIYGVEIYTNSVIIANIRSLVAGMPINIIQGNIISQNFTNLSANKVFSDHPIGMRFSHLQKYVNKNPLLKKYFKEAKRTVSGDWVFNMAAYLNMKRPGKTVVLMTNAGTWNKPDEELRQMLVEEGAVEGVILLPARLLSNTMIPLTMMVLSQNNKEVIMVDASEIFTEGRRQNSLESGDVKRIFEAYNNDTSISRKVPLNEIAEQEYILNPQRYIDRDIGIKDGISLGALSLSINRGAMIKSADLDKLVSLEETNYHYLMLKNINEGFVDNLPNLINIDDKYKKHCIKDRNLIISKISPFKIAMANVKDDKLILANGNLYFIELDETMVNPVFVEVFLRSEAGMAQLNRYAKGAAMKNISIQDLKRIKIPKLPRYEQDKIAEEYENLSDELIVLQRQMDIVRDKKDRLIEGVI